MPVTMEQVRAALDPEEPDYEKAAKLGADALPHLAKLIARKDPNLASKAASLAGMIKDERAVRVVEKAAKHEDVRVRVAAAYSAQYLPLEDASRVLTPPCRTRTSAFRRWRSSQCRGSPHPSCEQRSRRSRSGNG